MFTKYTIQSTIYKLKRNPFGSFVSFGMYSSPNATYYYVMGGNNEVFVLNDQWSLISSKTKTFPFSYNMINIGNSLYMTGFDNVWKLDKDLNILINYNSSDSPYYYGISYNPSNGLIYVLAVNLQEINVFNLDLTLIRRISTSPQQPWANTISSNQLYVGPWEGLILVYQNEILVNQFNGCNGNSDYVTPILFDTNGYMATTCYFTNKLYLYSQNGSLAGNSASPQYPLYIGFDSKGRFILTSSQRISIYD